MRDGNNRMHRGLVERDMKGLELYRHACARHTSCLCQYSPRSYSYASLYLLIAVAADSLNRPYE
jgi:hypothetical protein